jgi:glycolate oxidase
MTPAVLDALRACVGGEGVLSSPEALRTYECDALTNMRAVPDAVVLPRTTEHIQGVLRVCHDHGIPFVARGSGTGLSGGALPIEGGIVISLARMNRIVEVDLTNARVVVEPGVINLEVTNRVAPRGFFFAPDPSSQSVCSIGGNVAENSGGAHCLKYGFTTTHVTGLEVVLPDGSVVHLGGKTLDPPGYDLSGVFVGSEGTLGVAARVTLRVVKRPESVQTLLAAFDSVAAASQAVSDVIADGILASAMEIMDSLAIQAAEAAVHSIQRPNKPALTPRTNAFISTRLADMSGPAAQAGAGAERSMSSVVLVAEPPPPNAITRGAYAGGRSGRMTAEP